MSPQRRFELPPLALAERSGPLRLGTDNPAYAVLSELDWWKPEDPLERYELLGATVHDQILAALPSGWSLDGGRMLDFGCGTGRVMRHFAAEAETGEVWGCDIDRPSIEWAQQRLCPPFRCLHNGLEPPLPFEDGHFDLVLALSVFTHIVDSWSEWLLEVRRILKPDGLLFASFLGGGAFLWEDLDEEWDEDVVGMRVLRPWLTPQEGGPNVYHSRWWLQSHWGRAFEVLDIEPDGLAFPSGHGHGWVLLRPRGGNVDPDDLQRDEPGEPREWRSRRHAHAAAAAEMRAVHHGYEDSLSWRLTEPLRRLRAAGRRARRR